MYIFAILSLALSEGLLARKEQKADPDVVDMQLEVMKTKTKKMFEDYDRLYGKFITPDIERTPYEMSFIAADQEESEVLKHWLGMLREVVRSNMESDDFAMGIFGGLAGISEPILSQGFEAIKGIRESMNMTEGNDLVGAMMSGKGCDVVDAVQAQFKEDGPLSYFTAEVIDNFFCGGVMEFQLGSDGAFAAVDNEISTVYNKMSLLGMMTLDSIVSAIHQRFLDGLSMNKSQIVELLAMQELYNTEKKFGENGLILRMAQVATDVVIMVDKLNLSGVHVGARPFIVGSYLLSELIINDVVTMEQYAELYRFVPIEGFGCEHSSKPIVPEDAVILSTDTDPKLGAIFDEIIERSEQLNKMWTGYRAIVGSGIGAHNFRELYGGAGYRQGLSCGEERRLSGQRWARTSLGHRPY